MSLPDYSGMTADPRPVHFAADAFDLGAAESEYTETQGGYVTIVGPDGTVHTFPDRRSTNRQRRLEDRERNIQHLADRSAERKDWALRTKLAAVLGYIAGIATTLALLYLTS
jgi:hypothetical protein